MPSRRRRRSRPDKRTSARARRAPQPGRPFLRRRSTRWLIAAIVTLTVGIVLGVIAGNVGEDDSDLVPTPTLAVPLPDLRPPPRADQLQRAEVVEVIDGDTLRVRIPSLRSGQAGRTERVRYYGVDTPERGEPCFDQATERNEALVADAVLLLPDARERDRFDRLLRYVFSEEDESVDARLIAEGLGVAWREDGAYRDELVALEEEVRAAGAGCLWTP